jgi:uncharacterized membrane protein
MSRARLPQPGLVLLAVAVFAVVAKALAYLPATPEAYGFVEQIPVYREHRAWLLVHIVCGALALTGGTLQLIILATRSPGPLHRWTGRVYVLSVMAGGIAGLPLAWIAWGGIANTVAFGLLAVLWMFTTLQAMRAIRRGEVANHRAWIARSFALTLAGVTLRAELGLLQLMGLSFEAAYRIAPWSCWVLNLLALEWLRATRRATVNARAEAAAS